MGLRVRERWCLWRGRCWDGNARFQTDDPAGQVRQALKNVVAVLAEATARFLRSTRYGENIGVRTTTVETWHEQRLTVLDQGYR